MTTTATGTKPNILGALLDQGLALAEAPDGKAKIIAFIAAEEGGVEAAAKHLIETAPKPKGALGLFWPTIVANAESIGAGFVQQYGPEVIFELFDQLGHRAAAAAGR